MKKPLFNHYTKGVFLGSGKDMAKHDFDAYKVENEIHIVYEGGTVMTEKIENISQNPDEYLWTPFAQYKTDQCNMINSTKLNSLSCLIYNS